MFDCSCYVVFRNGLEDEREYEIEDGTLLANRYRVVGTLGKGAFSRVFRCFDLQLKDTVCVKVMNNSKDSTEAGLGEIKLLSLLNDIWDASKGESPFVKLRDYMYFREHLIIVTELLGKSLKSQIRMLRDDPSPSFNPSFNPSIISAQAKTILEGLEFLHSCGIKHCDIKPDNICLKSFDPRVVKLIDFGCAVCKRDCVNSYIQSRWYRAPEVMLGIHVDEKVDIWALGCALVELVLGYPIFQGRSVPQVLAAQEAVLGPHPPGLLAMSPATIYDMLFTPDGNLYMCDPDVNTCEVNVLSPNPTPLSELLPGQDTLMLDFFSSLLHYNPSERLSASAALQHPFILKHT